MRGLRYSWRRYFAERPGFAQAGRATSRWVRWTSRRLRGYRPIMKDPIALFSAMCDEPVAVRNYLHSNDTAATLDTIQALGAAVDDQDRSEIVIRGVGLNTPAEVTGVSVVRCPLSRARPGRTSSTASAGLRTSRCTRTSRRNRNPITEPARTGYGGMTRV